jgi:hypothetical protein
MSVISDITKTLNALPRGSDNSLKLQSTTFSNPQAVQFFKNALSSKDLTIGQAQIQPNGDTSVTVLGPDSMLGFDGLTLALTFLTDPDDAAVVDTSLTGTFDPAKPPIKLPLITWISLSGLALKLDMVSEFGILSTSISGNVNIGSKGAVLPIAIQRTGASQWSIQAAGDAAPTSHVTLDDLVELVGGEELASFIPKPLEDILDGISVTGIACQFDTQAKTVSYFSAGVALTNGWDINEKIGLLPGPPGPSMTLVLLNPVGTTPKTVIGLLRATARIGSEHIPVFLQASSGASTLWSVGVLPDDKVTLPGLSHILELAGGEEFMKTLPKGLSNIPDILLSRFIVNFDPTQKTLNEISFAIATAGSWEVIAGYLTIQSISLDMEILNLLDPATRGMQGVMCAAFLIGQTSVQFSVEKSTPQDPWTLSGWLAPGSSINLTAIAVKLFGGGSKVPAGVPEIVFDELAITVTPAISHLEFAAGSKTPWHITDGFALNYFHLDFSHDGQNTKNPFAGSIKTQIQIGTELLISLEADLNAPGTTGWTFIGDLETADKNINLGQIAQDIVTTFKVKVPLSVPDFVAAWIVQKLELKFNTDNKNFDFLLVLADSDAPGLTLDFGLRLEHGADTFSMTFDGKAIYNTAKANMEIDLTITEATQKTPPLKVVTFLGEYKTGPHPPSLADLLAAISQHFNTGANLPGELKLDAEVDGFAVFIKKSDADPTLGELAGAFKIQIDSTVLDVYLAYSNEVTSDAAFQNRLLVEGNPAYVLGATLGGVIDLSNLPVVGKIPGLGDWAIDKLGFFYTNAALKNKDDKAYFQVPQVSESKNASQPLAPSPAQAVVTKTGFNLIAVFGKKGATNQSPLSPFGTMNIPVGTGTPPPKQPPSFATTPAQPDSPAHWIDINKSFGPVSLRKIGLNYGSGEATLGFSAGFAVTAFVLDVDQLTITFPLPMPGQEQGNTVSFNLEGLSLDIKKGDLEIGGGFLKVVDENVLNYFGTVIVKAGAFGFTAIGGYAPDQEVTPKTPPNAKPVKIPASFFIFANISIPLGGPPCFFVTGFAGGFGINRNLLLPTIEELPDFPLLPHNANKNFPVGATPKDTLTTVLPALAHIFKDEPGEYWVAVGVQFTTFEMIESFAMVTVAFGVDFQLGLLGQCAMTLPPEDKAEPLAYIEIDIIASLNPAIGQFALDGRLTPSSFLFGGLCHISGGFAFYFWFGNSVHRGDFVVSIGGYHPAFAKDQYPHYPTVPRLSMSFGMGPFQMGGESYFALTASMLMAGLRVYAIWESGPLKAWFDAGFDFLLGWAPFHYEADAFVHIGISLDLKLFVISLHIGVALAMWGPDFGGLATIDLDIITFTIHFGSAHATPPPVGWNTFQEKFLPPDAKKQQAAPAFRGAAMFARAADAPLPTNKIGASVTKGLVPEKAGDLPPESTKVFDWVVDPNDFVISISSSIPSNQAWLNGAEISHNPDDYGQDSVPLLQKPPKIFSDQDKKIWNTDLNIGPMNKKGIHSYLTVTLTKEDGDSHTNDSAFTVTPDLLDVPQSLWGEFRDSSTTNPNPPNNQQLVPLTLVGLLLSPIPRHPGIVSNILLEALIFQHDHKTVFFYSSAAVDNDFSVTTPSTNDDDTLNIVIVPKKPEPTLKSPILNTNYILAALEDAWVSGRRSPILEALHDEFQTYSDTEVSMPILAHDKALTDWPAVALLGA